MLKPSVVPVFVLELLLASFFSCSAFAASTNGVSSYTSRLWQTSDGLPQDDVQALCQTRDGYVCVGTSLGLALFDGIRFTFMESTQIPEVRNHAHTLLCTGRDGTLWSASQDGLLRFWREGKASELHLPGSLTNSPLTCLFASRDGSIWIGTELNGLLHFKDGQFTRWNVKKGLSHRSVRSICEDMEGTIWVATGAGVSYLRGNKIMTMTMQDGLPHNSIRAVCADRNGNLWVASNFGLTRWKDGVVTHFLKADGLTDNLISVIFEDRSGTIWVGTLNGLNRFVDGKWLTETRDDGTSYDRVNCIFQDREENLWIGSRDGLSQLKSRAITPLTRQQGLTHNTTTSIFQDHAGTMWVGFWGGGVNKIDNGKVTAYTTKEGLSSDFVLTMHESREGDLWFGMDYDGGMTVLRNGRCIHYGARTGLTDQGIKVFQEDSQKNLWIGTRTALLRFADGKFTRFTTKDGLPSDTIEAIHEDHQGRLWFGTTGGLVLWQSNQFKAFTTEDGLSHNSVTAIHEDDENVLWLGTRGGGLNRLTLSPPIAGDTSAAITNQSPPFRIVAFTTAQGLFHDQIFSVLEDDSGFLWMGSPQGIFRVKKKDLDGFVPGKSTDIACLSFGKADGMVSIECKGSDKTAACKSQDGRLWFPTAKGVAIVDPNKVAINELMPSVFIEEVTVDRKKVQSQNNLGPNSGMLNAASETLKLPPGRGELEFHYTALGLRQPDKNRFKYKLEGADSDWVDAETRRVAYYNNIDPGSYQFRVLACNNDGVWNQTGATLAFVLLPHVWQTWWFKSSMVAGIGLVVAGIYRIRIARLQEIERLRLRIAADLHDEVGSTVASISALSEMLRDFGNIGEEEKEDVTKINQLSMQTANSIREIVWFINPEYDTAHELLLRMKEVADNLLGGITYRFETPTENLFQKLPLEFRQNLFLIFKETLTNIMKHSKASCVEIKLSEDHGEWRLSIQDNGIGFNPCLAGKGNGLKNLRRRADKLKGILEIKSQPGQGTSMRLSTRSGL
ncbi:MAG: putative two-component system sensor kinase [Verrucomicrobiales bacterium]|nr:putative two-component system sensor kinase [Verrucomicrobiales bacterium]